MKMRYSMILVLLALCTLLTACGGNFEEGTVATIASETIVPTEPAVPSTEPPTEPPIDETELPAGDEATGTLVFYIGEKAVYAGGPVADVLDAGVQTDDDFSQIIQPWHMSEQVVVRVQNETKKKAARPYMFLIAVNGSEEPKPLRECLIYSITVNYGKGIKFGSGNETEPFVIGETKYEALVEAYGEPDYSRKAITYSEIAYFEPFSGAIFNISNNVVAEISTYYAANIHSDLAEGYAYDPASGYFGLDSAILMSQYLDVVPYLTGKEREKKDQTGVLEKISEEITLGGQKIEFGVRCVDMPDPFGESFENLRIHLRRMCYVRVGRENKEIFYLINKNGQGGMSPADPLLVKGAITENRNYQNWGTDNSAFHPFQFEGVNQDTSITEILETYGQPRELIFGSNGKICFAWMHYVDKAGNTLRFRVDPVLNQLIEIQVSKYYPDEYTYH